MICQFVQNFTVHPVNHLDSSMKKRIFRRVTCRMPSKVSCRYTIAQFTSLSLFTVAISNIPCTLAEYLFSSFQKNIRNVKMCSTVTHSPSLKQQQFVDICSRTVTNIRSELADPFWRSSLLLRLRPRNV